MKNFKNISKLLLVSLIAIAITACSKDDDGSGDGTDSNGSAPKCELDLSKLTGTEVTVLDGTAGITKANFESKLFAETQKEDCNTIFKDGKVPAKLKIEVKDLKVVAADGADKANLIAGNKILTVETLGQKLEIAAIAGTKADDKGKITAAIAANASVKKEGEKLPATPSDEVIIKNITDLAFGACLNIENVASGKAKLALTCNATGDDLKSVDISNVSDDKALKVTGSAVADTTLTGTISFSVVE